jgi:pimeloyl-ACP methyl ester carboxylesterase
MAFCLSTVRAERREDAGPQKLFYQLQGKGSPLVILDVGAGESFRSWTSVVAEVAKETAVLVYDRAGYGRSEPGPPPRDARSETVDLWALLQKAALRGPYVLVGHSLGGLNMQVFGHDHPEAVAGMVLCDPPPRDWLAGGSFPKLRQLFVRTVDEITRAAERAERSDDPAERSRAPFLRTLSSEHREMFGSTAKQVLSIPSFGTMRMIVIAAGRSSPAFGEEADAFQKYWIEESRKLSLLSTAGEFVLAEHSGHQIHRDAPGLVLAAIKKLVGKADRRSPETKENMR